MFATMRKLFTRTTAKTQLTNLDFKEKLLTCAQSELRSVITDYDCPNRKAAIREAIVECISEEQYSSLVWSEFTLKRVFDSPELLATRAKYTDCAYRKYWLSAYGK